jgi:outer membrane protein assembly factor BamB
MNKMRNMILYSLLFILGSCSDTMIPNPTYGQPGEGGFTPEIIWKKQHGPTKFDQLAFRIELYKNNLIAGYQSELGDGYWLYDKNTGQVLKDIKVDDSFILDSKSKLISNYYVSNIKNRQIRLIHMVNGDVTYSSELGLAGNFPVVFADNYFYLGTFSFDPNYRVTFGRIRMDRLKEPWEHFHKDDWPQNVPNPRSSHVFCEGVKLNKKGEHVLYYGSSQLYTDTFPNARVRVQAYNVDQKKMLWQTPVNRKKEVYPADGGGPHSPYFYENMVLMLGVGYIWAYDKDTGKLLWDINLEQITNTEYKVLGQYLYILHNTGMLYKIDISNGSTSKTLQLRGSTGAWQEHNNILYFTTADGNLYAIDPDKLEVKWKWKSPNKKICGYCSFGNNSPIIDKETDRLYITDGREMFCIKLPE